MEDEKSQTADVEQLVTPDRRYIVVRQRLWRTSNPRLGRARVEALKSELMAARRDVRTALRAGGRKALLEARTRVNDAKVALGERGPVWWNDGARDYNRFLVKNTPYADWYSMTTHEQ